MLKKWWLFIVLIQVNGFLFGDEFSLAGLKQQEIENYKQKIAEHIQKIELVKKSALGMLVVLTCYGGYKFFFLSPTSQQIAMPQQQQMPTSQELYTLRQDVNILKKTNEVLTPQWIAAGYDLGAHLSWGAWLKGSMNFVGREFMMIGMANLVTYLLNPFMKYLRAFDAQVDRCVDFFFQQRDLSWFLKMYTNVPSLYALLEQNACELVSVNTFNNRRISFDTTWHLYIQQITSIVGFMAYKCNVLAKNSLSKEKKLQQIIADFLGVFEEKRILLGQKITSLEQHILSNAEIIYEDEQHVLTCVLHDIQDALDVCIKEFVSIETMHTF